MSPDERSLRARMAAHHLHAQRDGRETTAPARAAFIESFRRKVDPDGVLPAAERERRAQSALKAHMLKLALASASARRERTKTNDRPSQPPRRLDP